MPIWGNFKIAIFYSIYNTFSHFCVVFSDHVLQARGRGGKWLRQSPAARSAGSPYPPVSHTAGEQTETFPAQPCVWYACLKMYLKSICRSGEPG